MAGINSSKDCTKLSATELETECNVLIGQFEKLNIRENEITNKDASVSSVEKQPVLRTIRIERRSIEKTLRDITFCNLLTDKSVTSVSHTTPPGPSTINSKKTIEKSPDPIIFKIQI